MSLAEFEIIAKYFAAQAGERTDVALGIGDDAAVLDVDPDRKLVLAMDTIVAGVHFLEDADPFDIGYRALAVNLSDLAAMGAVPSWMALSLSMPAADERWLERFAAGLFELARAHDVHLIGGDTVRGPLVVTVQVGGWVENDRWLTRDGARAGDALFVSGVPGEAAAGLALLREHAASGAAVEHLRARFLRPEPRIALGRALRTRASAAMDISDGLLTDLHKLCAASGCGARLEVERLPVSPAASERFDEEAWLSFALGGGDDYELLFTIPAAHAAELDSKTLEGIGVCRIGVMTESRTVECFHRGQPFVPASTGYDHFAKP